MENQSQGKEGRRTLRISVPALPPQSASPNSREFWFVSYADNKIYSNAVFYCAIDARNRSLDFSPFEVARIDLELVFAVQRIRDEDNAIKTFKPGLDSLVRAGILKGDDAKHLHWGNITFRVSKEDAPKTIITLTEETA